MIILLTGLPGVGKGTQAEMLVDKFHIKHLSTGNIFRDLMSKDNELSQELKSYISEGKLVPDELTIKILEEEIKGDEYKNGFLLDGFPRTINQAKYLDELLEKNNLTLDYIINLYLDEEEIFKRLESRVYCPNCQATYNLHLLPPDIDGICDKCGSKLVQREDDKPEKIKERLEVAKEQTLPVIEYYKDSVITIPTDGLSKEEVFSKILESIND